MGPCYCYHLYLLEVFANTPHRELILKRLGEFAELLLRIQQPNGAIPQWIHSESWEPCHQLRGSAVTALLEGYHVDLFRLLQVGIAVQCRPLLPTAWHAIADSCHPFPSVAAYCRPSESIARDIAANCCCPLSTALDSMGCTHIPIARCNTSSLKKYDLGRSPLML